MSSQKTLQAAVAQARFFQQSSHADTVPTVLIFQAAEDAFVVYPKEMFDDLKPTSTRRRQLESYQLVQTVEPESA